jgi:putative transposase
LQHGAFLGPDGFVEGLEPLLDDMAADREIPRREQLATRPELDKLFEGVKDKKTRNQRIHRAVRAHEYTLKEAGEFLGLSYATISVVARLIDKEEKLRK